MSVMLHDVRAHAIRKWIERKGAEMLSATLLYKRAMLYIWKQLLLTACLTWGGTVQENLHALATGAPTACEVEAEAMAREAAPGPAVAEKRTTLADAATAVEKKEEKAV
eukprot:6203804-Pleurochrysis_carterae.AAC.1